MANGNGPSWHDNIPVWAKTTAFLVGTLGMPIIVAGYFMAMNAGVINSPQLNNERTLNRFENNFNKAVMEMRLTSDARDKAWEKFLHVQVVMCKNVAKDSSQARDCDYWRK